MRKLSVLGAQHIISVWAGSAAAEKTRLNLVESCRQLAVVASQSTQQSIRENVHCLVAGVVPKEQMHGTSKRVVLP